MENYYKRVERNVYLRGPSYYVYALRLGKRHTLGSFPTLEQARVKRDEFEASNPPRKPWSVRNVGRAVKTRREYYYEARSKGQCTSCTDPAEPGRVLCSGCAYVQKVKRQERSNHTTHTPTP